MTTTENGEKGSRDLVVAFRNALKLGGSLLVTWTVSLVVRFQLPRAMTPARFGEFAFADNFTGSLFILLGLGVDTYIQTEISVRPEHASDFFGGIIAARVALSALLLGTMVLILRATGRTGEIENAAIVFGISQLFTIMNASLGALLQASTKVGSLAVVNIATKLLYGAGVVGAIAFHPPMYVFALPLLASEAIKTAFLLPHVQKRINLQLTIRPAFVMAMIVASFPFFVNTIAITLGAKLNVTLMEYLAPNQEVGWYGAATQLSSIALLFAPLESWVLTPLLTRAKARSHDEFFAILRRAIEAILMGAIPATMLLALGADFWTTLAFGQAYAPAADSLRIMAPSFVLTYIAILLATALIILERSWTVTLISLGSLALQLPLIPLGVLGGAKYFGVGGAGMGNSFVFSFLELFSVVGFWIYLGKRAVDRKCVVAVGKALVAFALVAIADRQMKMLGAWRLIPDTLLYISLVLGSRAVRVSDLRAMIGLVLARRNQPR